VQALFRTVISVFIAKVTHSRPSHFPARNVNTSGAPQTLCQSFEMLGSVCGYGGGGKVVSVQEN
jgi:hypothetical protein